MKKRKTCSTSNAVYHFMLRWSIEYTQETKDTLLEHLRQHPNVDKFIFQAENTTDNPHYQGYFHTKKAQRPKQLGKAWNDVLRGAEIRHASTNGIDCLKHYCMKQDTRVAGPWADQEVYLGGDLWPESRWPPWQKSMMEILQEHPGDRKMIWIYDLKGNNGKTKFAKTLVFRHNAVGLSYGHSTDILNLVSKMPNRRIYIWNLTRAKPANLSELDLYSAMESVKDGFFVNLKYETRQVCMNPPHVIVMANHLPKREHISQDRWDLKQILDGELRAANEDE